MNEVGLLIEIDHIKSLMIITLIIPAEQYYLDKIKWVCRGLTEPFS